MNRQLTTVEQVGHVQGWRIGVKLAFKNSAETQT